MAKIVVRNVIDPTARISMGRPVNAKEYAVEIDDDAASVEMAAAHGFIPVDPVELTPLKSKEKPRATNAAGGAGNVESSDA